MAITNSFRNAVATGDVRGIRIMMKDSLLVDPTFTEFTGMERLAQSVSGLYDLHDRRELESDKSTWNDDYMNKLMVQVVGNFSHERINHLKDVVGYLRPAAMRPQTPVLNHKSSDRPAHTPPLSYAEQKRQDEHNDRIIYNRGTKIAAGAVAGGVVGGVAAAVVGGSLVVGAAAGAVIVGAVVAITTDGGQ